MATLCKNGFNFERPVFSLSIFASIIIHLAIFSQLGKIASFASPEKLWGRQGNLGNATEVSFFPVFAQSPTHKASLQTSPLELPHQEKRGTTGQATSEVTGNSVASRGIGQGGTSTSYHSVLHAFLDSAKVFPPSLKELGISGTVKVRFQVTPEGYLDNIRLVASDAPQALQREALRFLQKLKKVPIPPGGLSLEELQFELPLRYELTS